MLEVEVVLLVVVMEAADQADLLRHRCRVQDHDEHRLLSMLVEWPC